MIFPFKSAFANTRVPVLVRSHVILTVEMINILALVEITTTKTSTKFLPGRKANLECTITNSPTVVDTSLI